MEIVRIRAYTVSILLSTGKISIDGQVINQPVIFLWMLLASFSKTSEC